MADPPTGTAITGSIFTTRTGATTTTSPLTADASGIVQVWLETAQALDVVTTDNSNTAVFAGTARLYDFAPFLRVYDVSGDVEAHEADPAGAHAATAISAAPFATIEGTTVQAQMEEVFAEAGGGGNYAELDAANTFTTGTQQITGDADEVQLRVKANATQTTNLLELVNSSDEVVFSVLIESGAIDGNFTNFLAPSGPAWLALNSNSPTATYGNRIYGYRARGTLASRDDVQNGDLLFSIQSEGWLDAGAGGADFHAGGSLQFVVDGAVGTWVPARLGVFLSDGTAQAVERLRVDSDGKVWFDPEEALDANQYRSADDTLKTDAHYIAGDGFQGKYVSAAGRTNGADSDFTVTPADGAMEVVRNSSDGKVYLSVRANGAWTSVETT